MVKQTARRKLSLRLFADGFRLPYGCLHILWVRPNVAIARWAQLKQDALLVNPYDVEGVAEAIYRAWTMPEQERRLRMQSLRRTIREHDIFWWVDAFLQSGSAPKTSP